ncbi:MAG TPA: heavy metal-associated domain-containing protein, partial [Anaerolineales bacterium]
MIKKIEVPINGMDCAECTRHVQRSISALPGVHSAQVYLATEKAVVDLDPAQVDLSAIRRAVAGAGYQVPNEFTAVKTTTPLENFTRPILALLGVVFGAVLFIIVV